MNQLTPEITALSFGSCMAGSVIQALRESSGREIRFGSRVLHNRIDCFNDHFIRWTKRPIEWRDISLYLRPNLAESQLKDLRLYIDNQNLTGIGRHAIDVSATFFDLISSIEDPLIVIDNFMDIAAKLLEGSRNRSSGFLNWNSIDIGAIGSEFEIVDYLAPAQYFKELSLLVGHIMTICTSAKVAIILFPSRIEGHEDRHAVRNSAAINSYFTDSAANILIESGALVYQARDASILDLEDANDWSHFNKAYYHEIASRLCEWLSSEKKEFSLDCVKHPIAFTKSYTTSVVIQFYQDFDHISEVISAIGWVDEVIINDGPFSFAKSIFSTILEPEAEYRKYSECFFASLQAETGITIRYFYSEHENEAEKRKFGYDQAKGSVLLSIDADEILEVTREMLDLFVSSSALVGMFECINLTYFNLCLSKPMPITNTSHPCKPFAFKKDKIDANRHLDYLWLVGTQQNPTSTSDFFMDPICRGLHLTNIRSTKGAAVKFGFYTALAWAGASDASRTGPFADCLYYFGNNSSFSNQLKLELMRNALAASIGFPSNFSLAPFEDKHSSFIARTANKKAREYNPDILRENAIVPLLPGIPCFVLAERFDSLTLSITHSLPVQIVLHSYRLGIDSDNTHASQNPYGLTAEKNKPLEVSWAELAGNSDAIINDPHSQSYIVVQICCWAGDDVKQQIKTTGIPVYAALRVTR